MTTPLSAITTDDRCQPRRALDSQLVAEYADAMQAGSVFPPVTVFCNGESRWLADGFHRIEAARLAKTDAINCDIRSGTLRDAILHSVGANTTHGLRRSNADKHRAVESLLADEEWAAWSDREIARRCGVSQPFVGSVRRVLSDNGYQMERTVQRGNSVYEMNTGSIGRQFAFKVLPDMTAEEFAGLKQSIASFGMLTPVFVDHYGMVIDGNHRVKAWNELRAEGVDVPDYPRLVRRFDDDKERIEFAVKINCLRKQYTDEEFAMIRQSCERRGLVKKFPELFTDKRYWQPRITCQRGGSS